MVRAPGHPRSGRGNYVFEHIPVAEELIGGFLRDGETLHHRNRVRDDNQPENLELWTRPQPSGIRVSDAIEWARTSSIGTRVSVHLQRPPRSRVRALGGGGIRTRRGHAADGQVRAPAPISTWENAWPQLTAGYRVRPCFRALRAGVSALGYVDDLGRLRRSCRRLPEIVELVREFLLSALEEVSVHLQRGARVAMSHPLGDGEHVGWPPRPDAPQ